MRARRRPALQDKTPGNTPQSHHSDASKAKEALFNEPRKPLGALPIAPEVVPRIADENGTPLSVPPSPHPHHVRRVPQPPPEPLEEESGSELSAPPTPTPSRIRRPGTRPSEMPRYSSDFRSDAARHSNMLSAAMLPVPAGSEREPLSYGASSDSSAGPSPSPVKTMNWPLSNRRPLPPPTFRPLVEAAPSPLPTKHARLSSSSRPSGGFLPPPPPPPVFAFEHRTPSFVPPTPKPKHVKTLLRPANDEDGILASPTPIKSGFGPLLMQSTPAPLRKRRPRLPLNGLSMRAPQREAAPVAASSKAKGKQRAREESLPPSSPPPPSPGDPGAVPFAVREDLMAELEDDEPLESEDKENMGAGGSVALGSAFDVVPLQKERSRSSEDDPFGFIAAERKLKAIRKDKDKGKAPASSSRPPLGIVVVSRPTPSPTPGPSTAVAEPLQLPTPDGGSEADSNPGDDRFAGIDSPRLGHDFPEAELPDPAASDPLIQPAYDSNSDVLSYADPDEVYVREEDEDEEEDKENAAPPPAPAEPSVQGDDESATGSPEADPTRTPHKPKSARKRSPMLTPDFEHESSEVGEGTPSRSMGPAELLDLTRSVPARRPQARAAAEDIMDEDEARDERDEEKRASESEREEPTPVAKPATRKRRRGKEDEEDPIKAAKNLEKLLPKRPAKRAKPASDDESESESSDPPAKRARGRGRGRARGRGRGATGRGRGRGRGKARAEEAASGEEGGAESDSEGEEDAKPRSGTGRGSSARGRGSSRGRGRARGRGASTSSRPPSSSTRVTRSRSQKPSSKPDSKGKKRARDEDEEIDIEEDEERAQSRQARIEYFRKLDEYSLEKEDVYVI
ncbi:uncharacterized protein C8Q71DRAFT_860250 [Rhodofomes roseus]|uniref:Uncharacterized protein n=1 Tax=Rhodofomes roseus TaxID=34475 RepID=A0ABQ8K9J3_9APHY|nr:uncharacterized protein C8Q71DRAFT_860250 [Rhodofomes roseus]KAH9833457.1 hypothetical protein C8Q71DRAFT_860250 [Rhodofomes roseus]